MFPNMLRTFVIIIIIITNVSSGDVNGSQPMESQSPTTTEAMTTGNGSSEGEQLGNLSQPCNVTEFHCNRSDRCIPLRWLCDGSDDCGDNGDEVNCTRNHTETVPKLHILTYHPTKFLNDSADNCSLHEFRCFHDGRCVNKSWRCDGRNDCGDWSDERYCSGGGDDDDDKNSSRSTFKPSIHNNIHNKFLSNDTTVCNASEFRCHSNGRCLQNNSTCDGANDCGDWSDEKYCGDHLFDANLTRPKRRWRTSPCNETEFSCNTSGTCIPLKWKCDKDNDCQDWSDEADCVYSTRRPVIPMESYFQFIYPINGSKMKCNSSEEFHCDREDFCIGKDLKCDGKEDCLDGSDEKKCGTTGRPKIKNVGDNKDKGGNKKKKNI